MSETIHRREFIVGTAKATTAALTATSSLFAGERKPATEPSRTKEPKASTTSKPASDLKPYLELGKPNPAIPFTEGPCAVYGRYTADSRITFEGKCQYPWEFMATGTGVSGLTIAAGRDVTGQINHSAAFDEQDTLRSLARFRLDWYDTGKFWAEKKFSGLEKVVRMVHDLRRSVITITSVGGKGKISLEVRAHKDLDVIRIDVFEESALPDAKGQLHLQLQKDYPFEDRVEDNTYLSWHVNPAGAAANRCFGTALAFDVPEGCTQKLTSGRGVVEVDTKGTQMKYTLWIVAGSHAKGFAAWHDDVRSRLAKARAMGAEFIASHEAWWRGFWERSRLELPGDDGSHLRHQAAFELYRYYMACSADPRRETPLPFLHDLLGYNEASMWQGTEFMGIQDYQGWYGTMRTGDLDILGSCLASYVRLLPAMRRWVRDNYGHGGALYPYSQNIVQPYLGSGDITSMIGKNPYLINANGNLYMMMLFCDYAALGGDERLIVEGLLPWATGALTFFREHYPNKAANGRIDFTPSNGQESYLYATDSAELLVGMKSLLPRLAALGESRGWDKATLVLWRQMYNDLPDLPRGSIKIHENDVSLEKSDLPPYVWPRGANRVISLEKSDLLAPVRQLSPAYSHTLDRELPELLSIWPGKLVLRDDSDRDVALRSYRARLYHHVPTGWSLDVVYAACLGLKDEVKRWWPYHFDTTFTFPCGLGQDLAPYLPDKPSCTFGPSTQGLGTGVLPVLEMLLTDYPDLVVILPCWEPKVAVRYTLYSPYAGKVTVDYDPARGASVQTGRPIRMEFGAGIRPAKAFSAKDPRAADDATKVSD